MGRWRWSGDGDGDGVGVGDGDGEVLEMEMERMEYGDGDGDGDGVGVGLIRNCVYSFCEILQSQDGTLQPEPSCLKKSCPHLGHTRDLVSISENHCAFRPRSNLYHHNRRNI